MLRTLPEEYSSRDELGQELEWKTTVLGIPCLTLRDNPSGQSPSRSGRTNSLGTDPSKLPPALARLMAGQWKKSAIPPKWDGKAAERIVEHLERLLTGK